MHDGSGGAPGGLHNTGPETRRLLEQHQHKVWDDMGGMELSNSD